jgi:hypothetical protein
LFESVVLLVSEVALAASAWSPLSTLPLKDFPPLAATGRGVSMKMSSHAIAMTDSVRKSRVVA